MVLPGHLAIVRQEVFESDRLTANGARSTVENAITPVADSVPCDPFVDIRPVGAIAGAQIAASSSEEMKYDEFQEQRAEEARAPRIVAYEEFLDSSDQLDDARITLWNCYHVSPVGITQPESGESKIHTSMWRRTRCRR